MNSQVNGKAVKTRTTFRMEYSVSVNIRSNPNRIWAILTNAKDFPKWNSTVQSIEGNIALGETIHLKAVIAPNRTFNLKVRQFVPNSLLVWQDGSAPMFKGVRTYTLTPKGDGMTNVTMSEVFSGIMLPMIAGSLPDFRETFEEYAADLKKAAEKMA